MNRYKNAYEDIGNHPYEKMLYSQIKSKTIYGSLYKGMFKTTYATDKQNLSQSELIKRVGKVLRTKRFSSLQLIADRIDKGEFLEVNDLVREINASSKYNYNVSFVPVSSEYIEKGIYEVNGKFKHLYLFQIYCKDFSDCSHKTSNLHTMYFKELFSNENAKAGFPLQLKEGEIGRAHV